MNLVDLAHVTYPRQIPCRHCGCLIDDRDGRWLDRAGNGWCAPALLRHAPAPTPALVAAAVLAPDSEVTT